MWPLMWPMWARPARLVRACSAAISLTWSTPTPNVPWYGPDVSQLMDYGVAIIVSQLAFTNLAEFTRTCSNTIDSGTGRLPDRSHEEESRIGLQVSHDQGLGISRLL